MKWLKPIAAGAGGFIGYLTGGMDALMIMLITFAVIDYFTGVLSGWVNNALSSAIGFKGIAKKVCMFFLVVVVVMLDRWAGADGVLRGMILMFYIANEALSIVENVAKAGVPVPERLQAALAQLKNTAGKKIEQALVDGLTGALTKKADEIAKPEVKNE